MTNNNIQSPNKFELAREEAVQATRDLIRQMYKVYTIQEVFSLEEIVDWLEEVVLNLHDVKLTQDFCAAARAANYQHYKLQSTHHHTHLLFN